MQIATGNKTHNFNIDSGDPFARCHVAALLSLARYNKNKHKQR